jgi:hypothetical protein
MMNALIALGLGIIVFALIVATGLVIMSGFGKATASCPTGYTYNANSSGTTFTYDRCCLASTPSCNTVGTNSTPASQSTQSLTTMTGYVQSNLVTWIPAIIALGIGLLFIGALMGKRKNY